VIPPSYSYRQDMVRSVFGVVKVCPPPPLVSPASHTNPLAPLTYDSSKPSRPRNSLLAGITVVWLLLATVLFLYWNDIDAVPSLDLDFLHSSTSGTTARVALPSLDKKITAEEKKEYARNLVRLNETLRERFPHQSVSYPPAPERVRDVVKVLINIRVRS
jgi:hypothetical protein